MELNLVGKHVMVFAANYIYEGTLAGESHDAVFLDGPSIIYQTGPFGQSDWTRSERLPIPTLKIERSAVESMGALDRSVLETPASTPEPPRRRR